MKADLQVFSLGFDCEASFAIQELTKGFSSSLFSWALVPNTESLIQTINDSTSLFSCGAELFSDNMFRCNLTSIAFHGKFRFSGAMSKDFHDESIAKSYSDVKEKLAYLSTKFYQQLQSPSAIFILKYRPLTGEAYDPEKSFDQVLGALTSKAGRDDINLLYVLNGEFEKSYQLAKTCPQCFKVVSSYSKPGQANIFNRDDWTAIFDSILLNRSPSSDNPVSPTLAPMTHPSVKKTILLHAGAHKTGSSAIQQYLCDNNVPGYEFISVTSDGNSSGPLLAGFSESNWVDDYRRGISPSTSGQKQPSSLASKLIQQISESKSSNLIISAEAISRMPEEALEKLRSFLVKLGFSLQVIMYVRDPYDCTCSIFQQFLTAPPAVWLKGLNVYSFPSLDDLILKSLPRYETIVPRLCKVFGKDSVKLLPFGKSLGNSLDIVDHFISSINPDLPYVTSVGQIAGRNESLSTALVKLLWIEGLSSNWASASISLPLRRKAISFLKANAIPGEKFGFSRQALDRNILPIHHDLLNLFSLHFEVSDIKLGRFYKDTPLSVSAISDLSNLSESEVEVLENLAAHMGCKFNSANQLLSCQELMKSAYSAVGVR